MELFTKNHYAYPAWNLGETIHQGSEICNIYKSRIESLYVSWALGLDAHMRESEKSIAFETLTDPLYFLVKKDPITITTIDAYNTGE